MKVGSNSTFIHLVFWRLHHFMHVGSNSTIYIPFSLTDAFSSTWPFGDSHHVLQVGSNSTFYMPFTLSHTFSFTWSFGDSMMSCRCLMGLLSGCVGCLWMRLFMVDPMTPSAVASDPGGWRYCSLLTAASLILPSSSQFCRKNRPLSSQQSMTPAIKLFPGVVDTGQK